MATGPASVREEEGLDLAALLHLLWRRRFWLVLPLLLALAAAAFYVYLTPPRYRATTLLAVAPRPVAEADLPAPPPRLEADSISVDSVVQLLATADLLERAARRAGLPPEAAAAVRVVRRGRTRIIAIEAEWPEPEAAARLAEAVAATFLADHLARKRGALRESLDWLRARLTETTDRLQKLHQELTRLRREEAADGSALALASPDSLAQLERSRLMATAERRALEARLAALERASAGDGGAGPLVDGSSPYLERLETLRAELVVRQAALADRYGPRHPARVELERELRALEARIARERELLRQQARARLAEARAREQALERELASLRARRQRAEARSRRERELEQEMERLQALRDSYAARLAEAETRERLLVPDVEQVQRAVVAPAPVWPRPVPLLAFAATAGLGLGLFAVFLREQLDRGYREGARLARDLGVPAVVALPEVPARLVRDLPPEDLVVERPRGQFAEGVREALARLLAVLDEGAVVLVGSTLPGEGRSTVAVALARAAALEGLPTVLVDADPLRPVLRQRLGLPRGPGLSEVLRRGLEPRALLCDDPLTPLRVLPGMAHAGQADGLLAGEGVARLFQQLRRDFRLVVVDSAPLGGAAEALRLAALADGLVYVVRWGTTARSRVRQTVAELEALGPRFRLGVLQRVREMERARYGEREIGPHRRLLGRSRAVPV